MLSFKVSLATAILTFVLTGGLDDIKKFRLGVSDGSEICPSNNCEYRVEGGKYLHLVIMITIEPTEN